MCVSGTPKLKHPGQLLESALVERVLQNCHWGSLLILIRVLIYFPNYYPCQGLARNAASH